MKKLLKHLTFQFDYYLGYFMYSNTNNGKKWTSYMISKYPEKYPNEVKYLTTHKNSKVI